MTKSKRKTTKKVKSIKKKNSKFTLAPNSPFKTWDMLDQVEKDLTNKKIKQFVICGFARNAKNTEGVYADIKGMVDCDKEELGVYNVFYNRTGTVVAYEKGDKSSIDDFRTPPITKNGSFFYKELSDIKKQYKDAIRRFKILSSGEAELKSIALAYNDAITELEGFLCKIGQLEFVEKTCQCSLHPFTPTNSIEDTCKECNEDFELDRLQEKKEARERVMEGRTV